MIGFVLTTNWRSRNYYPKTTGLYPKIFIFFLLKKVIGWRIWMSMYMKICENIGATKATVFVICFGPWETKSITITNCPKWPKVGFLWKKNSLNSLRFSLTRETEQFYKASMHCFIGFVGGPKEKFLPRLFIIFLVY